MDCDSDSKPNEYIVLCRTCSHCIGLDSDPHSLFLYRTESEFESESVSKSVTSNVNKNAFQ